MKKLLLVTAIMASLGISHPSYAHAVPNDPSFQKVHIFKVFGVWWRDGELGFQNGHRMTGPHCGPTVYHFGTVLYFIDTDGKKLWQFMSGFCPESFKVGTAYHSTNSYMQTGVMRPNAN